MQLTTVVDVKMRVCATLEENLTLSVKVFASAEYAPGCDTTAEVRHEEISEALLNDLKSAMVNIQREAEKKLGKRIQLAIAKSTEVATLYGEI